MARRAIAVNEDNGFYEFVLGARPVSYTEIRSTTRTIEPVEHLMGWWPWTWAIRTESGWFFVDGAGEPQARNVED